LFGVQDATADVRGNVYVIGRDARGEADGDGRVMLG